VSHKYLVSYFHKFGQGRTFVTCKEPIDTEERVIEVERSISKINNSELVGIINIIPMRG
jgi:hypothetical protein